MGYSLSVKEVEDQSTIDEKWKKSKFRCSSIFYFIRVFCILLQYYLGCLLFSWECKYGLRW